MVRLRLPVIFLLILSVSLVGNISKAQTGGEEYFKENGHWVRGEFLEAYYSTPYYDELYGQPISIYFQVDDNQWVQYFDNVRFELHLDAPPDQRVQLTHLGEIIYRPGLGTPVTENSTNCRFYPETGVQVCLSFLEYFDSRGGVEQFGYPISNAEIQNGITMQYFQKARLEWRPEFPGGPRMIVSDLGRVHFHFVRENRSYLLPEPGDPSIESTVRLQARAYAETPVTEQSGVQRIYIAVQDQRLYGVEGASAKLRVTLPSGEVITGEAALPTDKNGLTTFSFPFSASSSGIAEVQVEIQRGNLFTETVTSFRVWP